MNHPLITEQDIHNGEELARIDGSKYHAVQVVYKVNGVGASSFYCHLSEWPNTEAGRLSRYVAEIERLRARIAELETSIALSPTQVLDIPSAPDDLTCPHCGAGPFQRMQGRAAHIRIKHGEKV